MPVSGADGFAAPDGQRFALTTRRLDKLRLPTTPQPQQQRYLYLIGMKEKDRYTKVLYFVVQCVGGEGGAEALCQDIARRYRKQ
jgi:hypothetical protein